MSSGPLRRRAALCCGRTAPATTRKLCSSACCAWRTLPGRAGTPLAASSEILWQHQSRLQPYKQYAPTQLQDRQCLDSLKHKGVSLQHQINASIGALCGCLCLQEQCLLSAFCRLLKSAIEAAMAELLMRVYCRLGMSQQKLTWASNFHGDHAAFVHSCENSAYVCTPISCYCVSQIHSPKLKPAKKAALEKLLRDAMNACLVKPFVDAAQADKRRSLCAMSQAWISYLANAQVTSLA